METVGVEDGSSVKEGDTLYIIEHGDLQTELKYYEEQLEDTENTLTLLDKYKQVYITKRRLLIVVSSLDEEIGIKIM